MLPSDHLRRSNLSSEKRKALAQSSEGKGASTALGHNAVFAYENAEFLKKYIEEVIHDKQGEVFQSLKQLKQAGGNRKDEESKPLLRVGQIIFGTVSLEHARGLDGTSWGKITNRISKLLLGAYTGQPRKYPYLHVAVYAGKCNGKHYVIENGGGYPDLGNVGMISAVPLEAAFEEDAHFFVLSPPRDSTGKSTRHLVLQRALSCLGTFFHYHMRAVSCEVFAMTLMKLEPKFEPIQAEVVRPKKGHEITVEKKNEDEVRYMKFHQALIDKLELYQSDVVLTLDYYVKNEIGKKQKELFRGNRHKSHDANKLNSLCKNPWWFEYGMIEDYESFASAVKNNDITECKRLIQKGLNIHGKLSNEKLTAIEYAKAHGFTDLKQLLENH